MAWAALMGIQRRVRFDVGYWSDAGLGRVEALGNGVMYGEAFWIVRWSGVCDEHMYV